MLRHRTATTALAGAILMASTVTACSGDKPEKEGSAAPEPTPTPTAAASAPVHVQVTRVAGSLRPAQRAKLAGQLEAPLQAYVDDAFLGDYPRTDFADAFASFTPGAARTA